MAPITSSVKSKPDKRFRKPEKVLGKKRPVVTRPIENNMEITIIPITEGSFKNRALIYAKTAARTIKIENE
jgi:hypothetical protein